MYSKEIERRRRRRNYKKAQYLRQCRNKMLFYICIGIVVSLTIISSVFAQPAAVYEVDSIVTAGAASVVSSPSKIKNAPPTSKYAEQDLINLTRPRVSEVITVKEATASIKTLFPVSKTRPSTYSLINKDDYVVAKDFVYDERIPLDEKLQLWIYSLCQLYDLDVYWVYALIKAESSFRANLRGPDQHDYGLMQIRDSNHGWLNKEFGRKLNYLDPYDNTLAGIYMLSNLVKNWGESHGAHGCLMAYNMGSTGAKRLWNKKIYSSKYSRKVMNYYESYQKNS